MRVLVVGCGSIGSRRARLLAGMGHEVWAFDSEPWKADAIGGRVGTLDAASVPATLAAREFAAVFVCTPAHTHLAVAREAITAGCRGLFIEKPLSTSLDGIPRLVAECEARGVVTMGACNMRLAYPQPIPVDHVSFETSGPLSGWRSGAADDYRRSGILLESAMHDLDLAIHWQGPITDLVAWGDDDHVRLNLRHGRKTSSVFNDWREVAPIVREATCRVGMRRICYRPDTSEGMYRGEMAHFLDSVASGKPTANPIAQAAETLRWALRARDLTRRIAA